MIADELATPQILRCPTDLRLAAEDLALIAKARATGLPVVRSTQRARSERPSSVAVVIQS